MIDQSLRDYQEMLRDYPVPTLVCGGARSAQPRAGLKLIVDLVKEGRLMIFESSGHCLFLEEPDGFNAAVQEFATSLSP
jgi:non-heme chloroperoxidase